MHVAYAGTVRMPMIAGTVGETRHGVVTATMRGSFSGPIQLVAFLSYPHEARCDASLHHPSRLGGRHGLCRGGLSGGGVGRRAFIGQPRQPRRGRMVTAPEPFRAPRRLDPARRRIVVRDVQRPVRDAARDRREPWLSRPCHGGSMIRRCRDADPVLPVPARDRAVSADPQHEPRQALRSPGLPSQSE